MTLQNRCDPEGTLAAVGARGLFTGNRGIIHDPATRTLTRRRWSTKSWIICHCEWKGRRREPMGRNGLGGKAGWTELFFLDEVTAISAGHRPCFACRRQAALAFAKAFAAGNGMRRAPARDIDRLLHEARAASGFAEPRTIHRNDLAGLPSGVIFRVGKAFFALREGKALRWSFEGYATNVDLEDPDVEMARLVTPQPAIAALAAGYRPVWHPSSLSA